MNEFDFKKFLSENNITARDLVDKTGYNKNTFTKWSKLKSDAKLPQDFIFSLITEYPEVQLTKYFPTHSKIIDHYKRENGG